jgi:hypothetical protein
MPNRISRAKPDRDQNATVSAAMISRVMAEMGRRGGRIGGKRRLVTLTDKRRRDIASAAAKARWKKHKAGGDNDD